MVIVKNDADIVISKVINCDHAGNSDNNRNGNTMSNRNYASKYAHNNISSNSDKRHLRQ